MMLQSLGWETDTAENGVQAVEFATRNKNYAMILMDVMMPECDGIEATRRIRGAISLLSYIYISISTGCCVSLLVAKRDV